MNELKTLEEVDFTKMDNIYILARYVVLVRQGDKRTERESDELFYLDQELTRRGWDK